MTLTKREQANRERLLQSKPMVYDKVIQYEQRLEQGLSCAVIQIQYDYICNFKCTHCAVSEFRKEKRKLDPISLKDFCNQAHEYGLAQIDFSGCEPLAYPDLEEALRAIGPERFFLQVDTNGYLMDQNKVKWLKDLGVDKIQIGFDSFIEQEHDAFRNKPGSYSRIMRAIEAVNKHGLYLQFATVVTPQRLYSPEFEYYLEFADSVGARVNVLMPKLCGEWAGRFDLLFDRNDTDYLNHVLSRHVDAGWRLTPRNGMDVGCGAVKRIIALTGNGDVLPCIWMYMSLGNIFETPLAEILEKGMRYFGHYSGICYTSQSEEFNRKFQREHVEPVEQVLTKGWPI